MDGGFGGDAGEHQTAAEDAGVEESGPDVFDQHVFVAVEKLEDHGVERPFIECRKQVEMRVDVAFLEEDGDWLGAVQHRWAGDAEVSEEN